MTLYVKFLQVAVPIMNGTYIQQMHNGAIAKLNGGEEVITQAKFSVRRGESTTVVPFLVHNHFLVGEKLCYSNEGEFIGEYRGADLFINKGEVKKFRNACCIYGQVSSNFQKCLPGIIARSTNIKMSEESSAIKEVHVYKLWNFETQDHE